MLHAAQAQKIKAMAESVMKAAEWLRGVIPRDGILFMFDSGLFAGELLFERIDVLRSDESC